MKIISQLSLKLQSTLTCSFTQESKASFPKSEHKHWSPMGEPDLTEILLQFSIAKLQGWVKIAD